MHFSTFFFILFCLKWGNIPLKNILMEGKERPFQRVFHFFENFFNHFHWVEGIPPWNPLRGSLVKGKRKVVEKGHRPSEMTLLLFLWISPRWGWWWCKSVLCCVSEKRFLWEYFTHTAVDTTCTQVLFSPEKKGNGRESPFFYNSEKRNLLFFYLKMSSFFLFHFESGFISVCPFDETIRRVVSPESDAEIVKNSSRETKQTSHVRKQDCIL